MAVWGAFCCHGPSTLCKIEGNLNAEKYIDILENELVPMIDRYYGGRPVKFIQDRSPIHGAHLVRDWFANHLTIQLLPWPPKGANLNPIENVWGDMVSEMNNTHSARSSSQLRRYFSDHK